MAGVSLQKVSMTMGSRIAVMREGRIQQVGEPLEIYERPRNVFVANFIGTPPMNLVRAKLAPGGKAAASRFALPLPLAVRPAASDREGHAIVLGIRPENIVNARGVSRGPTASLPVDVEFVEPPGDEVIVHGRVGEEMLLCKLRPDHLPEAGSRLEVAVELEKMHVFDAETELRLTA